MTCSRQGCNTPHLHLYLILNFTTIAIDYRKNQHIRATEVRVIDEAGVQLGVLATAEALRQAQDRGFDLVEVNPHGQPPVCKFVDYGKLQYEQEKQERKAKAKQKKTELKGLRLTARIGEGDLNIRKAQAQKWLDEGHKVQIQLQLRGREKAHPEQAQKVIDRLLNTLDRPWIFEAKTSQQGGRFNAIISLKKT